MIADNEGLKNVILSNPTDIHEYYVEIVGDNYLFDIDDNTEKVEAFIDDLLNADEADVLEK